jgi:hypothetical protein
MPLSSVDIDINVSEQTAVFLVLEDGGSELLRNIDTCKRLTTCHHTAESKNLDTHRCGVPRPHVVCVLVVAKYVYFAALSRIY